MQGTTNHPRHWPTLKILSVTMVQEPSWDCKLFLLTLQLTLSAVSSIPSNSWIVNCLASCRKKKSYFLVVSLWTLWPDLALSSWETLGNCSGCPCLNFLIYKMTDVIYFLRWTLNNTAILMEWQAVLHIDNYCATFVPSPPLILGHCPLSEMEE